MLLGTLVISYSHTVRNVNSLSPF